MPLPFPHSEEAHEKFMARCMGMDTMMSEYPEQAQRAAV